MPLCHALQALHPLALTRLLYKRRAPPGSEVDLLPHQNEVGIRYAVGRSEMIYGGTELGRYPREGIPRSYHVVGTTRIGLARGILVAYGIDVTVVCAVVSAVACGGARFTSDASAPFHVPRHKADARGRDVQVASGYVGSAVDDGHVIGARALVADRKVRPERERVMRRSPRRGCEDRTRTRRQSWPRLLWPCRVPRPAGMPASGQR